MLFICLLSCCATAAASSSKNSDSVVAPVPTLMPSPPPPDVGTTPPELMPDTTPQPRNWVKAGPVSFDADKLTLEERASMIRQLQLSIQRSSMANYELVAGLETSREKPCFKGQSARFRQTLYGDDSEEFQVTMTLTNILRGEEADAIALPLLQQAFTREDVLKNNMEFIVCDFDVSVTASDPNMPILIAQYDFVAVSDSGRPIERPMLLTSVDNMLTLYPGGNGTLQVIVTAEKGTYPTILYLKEIWFSLLEPGA